MAWLYLIGYLLACGIGWLVSTILEYIHNHKELKSQYEALQKKHEALIVDYNALVEEHTEDMVVDYSIMAGLIEEHTTQLADIHKWMDEHDAQTNALSAIRIQIVVPHAPQHMHYEYAGMDECNENPYPEPEETPLVQWVQDAEVEGLDEL